MENKIQELTDKIYREGVEKGNEEAQRLIANAQEEAKKIIEDGSRLAFTDITDDDTEKIVERAVEEIRRK